MLIRWILNIDRRSREMVDNYVALRRRIAEIQMVLSGRGRRPVSQPRGPQNPPPSAGVTYTPANERMRQNTAPRRGPQAASPMPANAEFISSARQHTQNINVTEDKEEERPRGKHARID
ncbi:MAG: hypothetical protein LUB61_04485 [Eggerthellaceae bacterium]|nr:hypothetical protein [Eggerthellaceae bacterium]